jgi:hypothetical protein
MFTSHQADPDLAFATFATARPKSVWPLPCSAFLGLPVFCRIQLPDRPISCMCYDL